MLCMSSACGTAKGEAVIHVKLLRVCIDSCLQADQPVDVGMQHVDVACAECAFPAVQVRGLEAYSISCGQSLIYNNIFPKHRDRLGKKMSELVKSVAKMEISSKRNHFDVVVACEDEEGEDLDVPLVSVEFRGHAVANGA